MSQPRRKKSSPEDQEEVVFPGQIKGDQGAPDRLSNWFDASNESGASDTYELGRQEEE